MKRRGAAGDARHGETVEHIIAKRKLCCNAAIQQLRDNTYSTASVREPPMSASNDEIQKLANAALQAALRETDAGRHDQAGELYRAVLQLQPDRAEAHVGLGLLEREAGDPGAAIPHFANALQAAPEEAAYWLVYLDALMAARQYATARELIALGRSQGLQGPELDAFEQQLSANAAPEAQEIDAAAALFAQGNMEAAAQAALGLTDRFPQHAFGWKLLGASLYKNRKLIQAMVAMEKAAAFAPDDAETLCNLGVVLKDTGRHAEALQVLEQSLAMQPDNPHALSNMASALREVGRLSEAHASAAAAVRLDPGHAEALNTLAVILEGLGRPDEALDAYRRALQVCPDHSDARSNMLFCMSHTDSIAPRALFDEHRQFGLRLEACLTQPRAWDNTLEPARPLRIGFVSGDLRNHAVASFVEPVFACLARRPGLVLHAYYNYPIHDEVTARVRGTMAQWRDVAGFDDAALDALIRADGIDILIDLSGHTAHNRLPMFARKPAPLQATWIGYPGTTGLAAMDYCLSDPHMLPHAQFDDQFTEKLVRLPTSIAFKPPAHAPELLPLPALANGYLTFASFNRLSKINRRVIARWGSLLRALPDARLLLAAMPPEGRDREQLPAWLQEEGIDLQRTRFHPRTGLDDYLALHQEVDVCLDTFPYTGGTTTLHALHMGVPTLTLAGATMAGRQGACMLGHHGLQQFIATDTEDFVRKGIALSKDLPALAQVRSSLRGSSRLWGPDAFDRVADGLEQAFRLMWQRWCAGLPAAAIDLPGKQW